MRLYIVEVAFFAAYHLPLRTTTTAPVDEIKKTEQCYLEADVCLSPACVHAASAILSSRDINVDPCTDFYRYACGGWVERHAHRTGRDLLYYAANFNQMPEEIDKVIQELLRKRLQVEERFYGSEPYEKLFDFYSSCMDVDRIVEHGSKTVFQLLKGMHEFQVGQPFDSSSWNLTAAIIALLSINVAPLFDVSLDADAGAPHRWAVVLSGPRRFGLIPAFAGPRLPFLLSAKLRRSLWQLHRRGTGAGAQNNEYTDSLPVSVGAPNNGYTDNLPAAVGVPNDGYTDSFAVAVGAPNDEYTDILSVAVGARNDGYTDSLPAVVGEPNNGYTDSIYANIGKPNKQYLDHSIDGDINRVNISSSGISDLDKYSVMDVSSTQFNVSEYPRIQDINRYFIGDFDEPLPNWLEEILRTPVPRNDMYRIIQEGLASDRRRLLLEGLKEAVIEWGEQEHFITGAAGVNTKNEVQLPDDGATETDSKEENEQHDLEAALQLLEERFLAPLDAALPSKREQLLAQQRDDIYNAYSLQRLQQDFPAIEWRIILQALVGPDIEEKGPVYVYHTRFLHQLCELIVTSEPWLVHWGVLALLLHDVADEIIKPDLTEDREQFCVEVSKNTFGEVVAHLYLHHTGEEAVTHVQQQLLTVLEDVRRTLDDSLRQAPWLSDMEKSSAREKLWAISSEVGAMPHHWDIEHVTAVMGELVITKDDFVTNVINLYSSFRKTLFGLYAKPLDKEVLIWDLTVQPFVVNAFHVQTTNSIVFPEAFFKPPYYRRGAPASVTYGTLGVAVSHELFHAFELSGLRFSSTGVINTEYGYTDLPARLRNTSHCYHQMLTQHFQEVVNIHGNNVFLTIDSNATFNENLADVFALRNAFWSYRDGNVTQQRLPAVPLSDEQLFFVAAAQPYCAVISPLAKLFLMELDEHLPNDIRVNAMMRNTPEFRAAFTCSVSAPMSADVSCSIFDAEPETDTASPTSQETTTTEVVPNVGSNLQN